MKGKIVFCLSFVLLIASFATAQIPCGPNTIRSVTLFVNWPQFRYDTEHTGCNPYETILSTATAGGLVLDWMYRAGAPVYGDPAVANGVVYFTAISPDNTLYAVNARTGSLIWKYSAGQSDLTSPVVVNRVVYVGSPENNVYAFNSSTGDLLWQRTTASVVGAAPVVADGVLYVGDGVGYLYALNASTGTVLWTYRVPELEITASPAVHNGVVYFAGSDPSFPGSCTLFALDIATRQLIWQYTWPFPSGDTPVFGNGAVYLNGYALNANTGAVLWTSPVSVFSLTALANGVLYVGSNDNKVYALNAYTGEIKWHHGTGNFVSSAPTVANGVVYVESDDGNFYVLNAATGALLWQYKVSTYAASAPTVANGLVYIGSEDSNLYAFHLPGH